MDAVSLPIASAGIQSEPSPDALPCAISKPADQNGASFSDVFDQYSSADTVTGEEQTPATALPNDVLSPVPVSQVPGSLFAEAGINQSLRMTPPESANTEGDTVAIDQPMVNPQGSELSPPVQPLPVAAEPLRPMLLDKAMPVASATPANRLSRANGEWSSATATATGSESPVIAEISSVRGQPQLKEMLDLRAGGDSAILPKLPESTVSHQNMITPATGGVILESPNVPDSLSAAPAIKGITTNTLPQAVPVNRLGSRLIQMISKGESAIEIRLDPPELGKLTLSLVVEGDALSLQVSTTSAAAKELIMAQGDRLRQALAEQDLSLSDLSVDVQSESSDRQDSKTPDYQPSVETATETIARADWGEDTQNFMSGDLLFRIQGGRLLDQFI